MKLPSLDPAFSSPRGARSMARRFPSILAALAVSTSAAVTAIDAAAQGAPEGIALPAGGGQSALAVRVTAAGIAYRACSQAPCSVADGDPVVALPAGVAAKDVVIEPLAVGNGRHAAFVHTPAYGVLLAAVPGGAPPARVLWSGVLGFSKGEAGEQSGEWLEITEPDEDGVVRVLAGQIREDVTICGRRSLLSPRVLDPRDFAFKGAKVQRLRRDERDRATELTAAATSAPSGPAGPALLQGVAASSGVGGPAALTDGNLDTTWAENRGGDGNGEFVQMNAPEQVEITSISVVARPSSRDVPKGVAPRKVWLATPDALFAVTFPEDPWGRAGASYDIRFPAPLRTRCVALVLDEAYARGKGADAEVTLAEVTAHTELDGKADPAGLAGALAGGQARARMAAALLQRGGEAAHQAAIQAYPALDDAGRVLALEVIDSAPCSQGAPLYVKALEIGKPGEIHHAADRLVRCARQAAPALSAALPEGPDALKIRVANLLALVAPDVAIAELMKLVPAAKPSVRAEYRAALTRASQSPAARDAVRAELDAPATPPLALIDLLRAVTARPAPFLDASPALARLVAPGADFRTRYLLLGPAAALARGGDGAAEAFVLRALSEDPDPHVRARAAEVAGELPKALEPLARALDEKEPRIRDAALVSLAKLVEPKAPAPAALFPSVARLLAEDPFTFVRTHAADALAFAPAGGRADQSLVKALVDVAPTVRAHAVETLGRRGARDRADDIRERLDDDQENLDVRVRAARALGRLCHVGSADRLTELARKDAGGAAGGDATALGSAAASALVRLNPPDLAKRLAPLSDRSAPPLAQQIARTALSQTERCR